MATYNGEQYIEEQVRSILSQIGTEDELVVSDDNSTDNTVAILERMCDSRIRVIHNIHKKGMARRHQLITRNFFNAIENSHGDIIFLADQDDVWMPEKVSVCLHELLSCDLVIHNAEKCNKNMESMNETMWPRGFRFRNYLVLPHSYMGCCMAFRRKMLRQILPPPFLSVCMISGLGLSANYAVA